MAIEFITSNPSGLLAELKKAIDNGSIVTWSYDKKGYFTHTPEQWKYDGYFYPHIYSGKLVMNFHGNTQRVTSKTIYGVYHGRLLEAMLTHFDLKFTTADASALPTSADHITKQAA